MRHLRDGTVTLTVSAPALQTPVLFVLSADACAHLVRLLTESVPAEEARDAA